MVFSELFLSVSISQSLNLEDDLNGQISTLEDLLGENLRINIRERDITLGVSLLHSALELTPLPDEDSNHQINQQQAVIAYYQNEFEKVPPCFVAPNQTSEFFQECADTINTNPDELIAVLMQDLKTDKSKIYQVLLSNYHKVLPGNMRENMGNGVIVACLIHCAFNQLKRKESEILELDTPRLIQPKLF